MQIFIIIAAFILGAAICGVVYTLILVIKQRRKDRKNGVQTLKARRKLEFSKIVLALVLLTYFVGVFIGVKISLIDVSQLGVLLAYIGTPTAAAIGFYCWKAKAENIVKIKRDNPEETQGIPVDLNNVNTD